MFVVEIDEAPGGLDEIAARRPIVRFVVDRLIDALNRPRPVGRSF